MSIQFKYTNLGTICDLQIGKTPSRKNSDYWGEGVPWVSISDMKEKYINVTKEQITLRAIEECGCKLIPKGTLLLSFKLSIGKVCFAGMNLFTNEAIVALTVKDFDEVTGEYLYYTLKTLRLLGSNRAAKGNILNVTSLKNLLIPLPENFNDQFRIIKILQKIDEITEARRNSIHSLDSLLTSIFFKMFGKPVNSNTWPEAYMREFGEIITGNTPPRANKENYGRYIEWVKTDNILSDSVFITEANEYLSVSGSRKARVVGRGALLIACIAGSLDSIGRAALANRTVAFNQQINAIEPKDDVAPLFLYWLFKIAKPAIQRVASKGMKAMVTKTKLEQVRMIKPPFARQKKFAEFAERVERLKEHYIASITQLEYLLISTNHSIFAGELDISSLDVSQELEAYSQTIQELLSNPNLIVTDVKDSKQKPRVTKRGQVSFFNYYETDFADLLKTHFDKCHFRFEDIENLFAQEEHGELTYYTTEELKKIAQKDVKDIHTFIFDCVESKSKVLKLRQFFYDALSDLHLKQIRLKEGNSAVLQQIEEEKLERENLSGMYFEIIR